MMKRKLLKPSDTPLKYSSTSTRFQTLDIFCGGAQGEETHVASEPHPGELVENLEQRFNSGVNRSDMPRRWGYPSVDRKLANRKLSLADDIAGFRRENGEVLYKK